MQLTAQKPYTLTDNDIIFGEAVAPYIMRVKDLPEQEKPREKLIALGPKSLSVAELMAVLLGVGTKKEEVMIMAQRIIKEYGEKAIVNETKPLNLSEALDIPLNKACQVVASFELGRRFYAQQAGRPVFVRDAKQAYQHLKGMGTGNKEQLRGLYLNSRYQVIHDEVISVGTLSSNIVHPREVFQPAIEHSALAVIIAHNHPSGNLEPTTADIEVTKQIIKAGKILGIELLDHLVITSNKYVSIMSIVSRD